MPSLRARKRHRSPSPRPQTPATRTDKIPRTQHKVNVHTTLDASNRLGPSVDDNKAFLDALSDDEHSSSETESSISEPRTVIPKRQKTKAGHGDLEKPEGRSATCGHAGSPSLPNAKLKSLERTSTKASKAPIAPSGQQIGAVHSSKRAEKGGVFTDIDKELKTGTTEAANKAFLDAMSDEQSSLSDIDSDDFVDILPAQQPVPPPSQLSRSRAADSEDELVFEDVQSGTDEVPIIPDITDEDLRVTIRTPRDTEPPRLTLKQGGRSAPTKKMRKARERAHCMHVQFLLWHNVIRNSWVNDPEVHRVLIGGLSDSIKAEVNRWKVATGQIKAKGEKMPRPGGRAKGRKVTQDRTREWGAESEKLTSHAQADPLIRLLKYLAAYWKKRFRVSAPSLRKMGYRDPRGMREVMDSWNNEPHDPKKHGERLVDREDFVALAKHCAGSRDVGAQLFTALLRGLGIEARIVVSLQPTGFGWTKSEEAHPLKSTSPAVSKTKHVNNSKNRNSTRRTIATNASDSHDDDSEGDVEVDLCSDSRDIAKPTNGQQQPRRYAKYDTDLLYPTYWTEALSPASNSYIPVSTLLHPNVCTAADHLLNFEPRGAAAERARQVMAYVVAFSADGSAKDVTVRYLRNHQWPGKTKNSRLPTQKIPVHNKHGKIVRHDEYDWFKRVMRGYGRPGDKCTLADELEDNGDLIPLQPDIDQKAEPTIPETLQGYKQSAEFVLERHFRREEALLPSAKPVKHFHVGKGDKMSKEPVFKRSDVVTAKTVETWHKEGRQVKVGEQALKHVPYRAVTLLRKREIEDQTRDLGTKPTQGLYAEYQTEWIIPDPIGPDRVIPKNAFGNIDVYVPSMVPRGAIHLQMKGTVRVCKRLGIDFAEAVTGFEFGKQRAVPVITGVVIAEENEELVIDAWKEDERLRQEKEVKKRTDVSLAMWKKFFRGLRIRERMRKEYGATDDEQEDEGEMQQWAAQGDGIFGTRGRSPTNRLEEGGFVREGASASSPHELHYGSRTSHGGFLSDSDHEQSEHGDLQIIGGSQGVAKKGQRRENWSGKNHVDIQLPTPISLQAKHAAFAQSTSDEDAESSRFPTAAAQDMLGHRRDEQENESGSESHDQDSDDEASEEEFALSSRRQKATLQVSKTRRSNPAAEQAGSSGKRPGRNLRSRNVQLSPYFSQ